MNSRTIERRHRRLKAQRGMTLVEIIVVLIILGLVGGFLMNGLFGQADKAKVRLTNLKMERVKGFINQYQLQYNSLPSNLDDLLNCGGNAGTSCTAVANNEEDLKDDWGTPFAYTSDGRSFTLKSLGSDRRDGGSGAGGDISVTGP